MNIGLQDLEDLCEVSIYAAQQAGAIIQEYTKNDFAIHQKESGSSRASQIVTEVDYKSQEKILEILQPACQKYDLGLLAEENEDDQSRLQKQYFWCIDPLDGTLPFVEKRPGYAVSIALVSKEGKSILGVVFDPLAENLYYAIEGLGAFRNHEFWQIDAPFATSYQQISEGGAVMNACWTLEKAPAYFIKKPKEQNGGGCLWDYAATTCLFQEVGAYVSDCYGKPLQLNNRESVFMNKRGILYASHSQIWEKHIRN